MKASILLDRESADILKIVFGQGGFEYEEVDSVRDMTTKCLFISNSKFSIWRYWYLTMSRISYVVVRDVPAYMSGIAKKFYLHAVGEISYPTKTTEVDKCLRAMVMANYKKSKKVKNARATTTA